MAVIEVRHLKKSYPLYSSKKDKLKEALSLRGKIYHKDFEALRGISFSVEKGECVGIIGVNGSGKSTLARVITGLVKPTGGTFKLDGSVAMVFQDPLGSLNQHLRLKGAQQPFQLEVAPRRFIFAGRQRNAQGACHAVIIGKLRCMPQLFKTAAEQFQMPAHPAGQISHN